MALRGRGTAYGQLQNYDSAIADFTRALRLDPNHQKARANLSALEKS